MSEATRVLEASAQEARYANYFQVGHHAFEFLLDFGQLYSDDDNARLHTRIIMSPAYARTLLNLLRMSVESYERAFGEIPKDLHDE